MKCPPLLGLVLALAGAVDVPRTAFAANVDVETDHIDAADDGGPRHLALLANGIATALGRIAVELDGALGQNAAVTLAIRRSIWGGAPVYGAALGVALFPLRFAFRGLYVHLQAEVSNDADLGSPSVFSPAMTVGYQWVCPIGCTLRLGGGLTYGVSLEADSIGALDPLLGIHPAFELSVGWIF